MHAALLERVRDGLPITAAAESCGVSPATVREWLRRGEGRDDRPAQEPYATFATEVRAAEADLEREALECVQAAADRGTWRAAAWFLERRFPERWGRRRVVQAGGTGSNGQGNVALLQRFHDLMGEK